MAPSPLHDSQIDAVCPQSIALSQGIMCSCTHIPDTVISLFLHFFPVFLGVLGRFSAVIKDILLFM